MEPEGSLPHSQVPASYSYPERTRSIHAPTSHFLKIHLNIILHLRLDLPSGLFPSGFPTKTLYTPLLSPIRATSPTRPVLLDLITRTILGEEYWTLSSLLCSFLHSAITSSLLIFKFFYSNLEDKNSVITSYLAELNLSKYAIHGYVLCVIVHLMHLFVIKYYFKCHTLKRLKSLQHVSIISWS
jgi:hypothetical protein